MVTFAKALGLLSAAFGAAGTCSLYFGTFGYEMPGGFLSPPTDAVMEASARNKRRQCKQRWGLTEKP
jgi:hypothetical protein